MEWISVEDRLPEDGRDVRVKRVLGMRETIATYGGLWWLGSTTGESGTAAKLGITHWRPLTPEEPAPVGWISVEERLPCCADKLLAIDTEFGIVQAVYLPQEGRQGHCWHIQPFQDSWYTRYNDTITHWMPFPEPPPEPEDWPAFSVTRLVSCNLDYCNIYYETGEFVCTISNSRAATAACNRLNKLWALDKGTKEEH